MFKYLIFFFILMLTLVALEPLLDVGFTTSDDLGNYLRYTAQFTTLDEILSYVKNHGFKPLHIVFMAVPYIFDSFIWLKVTQIFAIVASFVSLSILIRLVTNNIYIGVLSYVLLIGLMQNSWGHNILTSYPFAFHMSVSFMFTSMILFYYWIDNKKPTLLLASIILYVIPLLVIEISIFYSILFPLIVAIKFMPSNEIIKYKKEYSYSLLYVLIAFLHICIYFWLKSIYGESYSGTKLELGSIQSMFDVLIQYSISSFPSYVYFKLDLLMYKMSHSRDFLYSNEMGLLNIFKLLDIRWYFIAFINSIFVLYIINKIEKRAKLYFFLFIISVIFIFLPNIPVSLVEKYRAWIKMGDINYVYTFYSYVAMMTSFIAFFGMIASILKNKYQTIIFSVLVALFIFTLSIFNGYGNQQIYKMQELSQNKWNELDEFLKTASFKNIPENSIIIAPSMISAYSIIGTDERYWERYIKHKSNKKIRFVTNLSKHLSMLQANKNKSNYYLRFNQNNNSKNQYIVFSRIHGINVNKYNQLELYSNQAIIFTTSNFGKIALIGEKLSSDDNNIKINNVLFKNKNNHFSKRTIFGLDGDGNMKIIIVTGTNIIANRLSINPFAFSNLSL